MADKKISALPAASTPLAGTEILPIVQSGVTDQVSVANLTAGRPISATQMTLSSGNLIIGTADRGIDFSANPNAPGMTSELLNDYEEGTWTPTFTSTGATITHAQQRGAYTKVGRLVTASVYVQISSVTGTLTNSLTITGLPFATIPTLEYGFSAAIGAHQFTSVTPSMFMAAGSSTINVYVNGTVTPITAVAISAGYYLATISYMVG